VDAILPAAPNVNMAGPPSVQYGTYTGAQSFSGVSRQPRYIIEIFGLPSHAEPFSGSPYVYYRITARGYGGNPNSQVTLQEVFIHYPS
jgi:Tfp pilus assembly protein PilX